ncbi:hypothetical protein [Paucibacter sediminis]|uniref:hypothetical protein n=1 Tax=Paucibacter sediminis TaxID=3019553 RepID=UPI0031455AD0
MATELGVAGGDSVARDLLDEVRLLAEQGRPHVELRQLGEVQAAGQCLPLLALVLGNPAPDCPAVGYFGGVHGLERIGIEVVLAFLRSLVMRLRWDATLHAQLAGLRMVFMPLSIRAAWQEVRAPIHKVWT